MKYFGDDLGGLHKEMGSIIRKRDALRKLA